MYNANIKMTLSQNCYRDTVQKVVSHVCSCNCNVAAFLFVIWMPEAYGGSLCIVQVTRALQQVVDDRLND